MSIRDRIPFFSRRTATPPPMSCRELVGLVTDYLEGALTDPDRERLEAHLVLCEACTMYMQQMRDTLTIVGAIEPEDVSPAAYAELSAVFSTWQAERSG